MNKDVLSIFDPVMASWFTSRFSAPTDIQQKAWPVIAKGGHTLISAPTGTGKTLTAFLWTLNQLITGAWETGTVRTLYISPLKALNTDIRINLLLPLHELRKEYLTQGIKIPSIGIMTRSGDTPLKDRRMMVRRPPEILITTPESLNLILSSPIARNMLNGVKTVILDEIHAIASDKRGSYLITAIERLELLNRGFQRIALSATVKPLEAVAAFIGGAECITESNSSCYLPRQVQIVCSDKQKKSKISVEGITLGNDSENDQLWRALANRIRIIIERNSSTLIFVNNRRLAERLTLYINENNQYPLAYSHHGSLSKELRLEVECKLKSGALKAIVATSTLEMGIDVGSIDEVILVQTPTSVSSTLQRIGRAGHSIDRVSIGTIMPVHGLDYLNAAIMARLSYQGDIEEIHLVQNPLDVLAQVLLSMIGIQSWNADKLFCFIKCSAPYFTLTRAQFDNVISMLTGRYQETRIRELRPRIIFDCTKNKLVPLDNLLSLIYKNCGTIPDKGYYGMRLAGSGSMIGELDEEFVWERRIGDTFLLGTQHWRIEKIGTKDIEVSPWSGEVSMSPFWKAEAPNRTFHVSEAVLKFLEDWSDRIETLDFKDELEKKYFLNDSASQALSIFLQVQKEYTGSVLPHRHHVIFENVYGTEEDLKPHTLIHTLWGNLVNYPFMLALSAAWEIRYGRQLQMSSSNDLIFIAEIVDPQDIVLLVKPLEIDHLLRKSLEKSNYFGARFRENSGRALLLPRFDLKRRMPFWITRERSKRLFDAVRDYDDFPMLLETWRTCLKDDFDLDNLLILLTELRSGEISTTSVNTSKGSPFSGWMKWQVTNTKLYQDDTPNPGADISAINSNILKDLVFTEKLRPPVKTNIQIELEKRLQRTSSGYAPSSALELIEWIKDRICIAKEEWDELLSAIKSDSKDNFEQIITEAADRLCRIYFTETAKNCIIAIDNIPRILNTFPIPFNKVCFQGINSSNLNSNCESLLKKLLRNKDPKKSPLNDKCAIIAQWMEFYGPVDPIELNRIFSLDNTTITQIVSSLVSQGKITENVKIEEDSKDFICDSQNLERLFRMMRNAAKSSFKALPIKYLPLFLAKIQHLTDTHSEQKDLKKIIELYFGYQSNASLWESEIFASRLSQYIPYQIDSLMNNYDLQWIGCGKRKLTFCLSNNREVMVTLPKNYNQSVIICDYPARYTYTDLLTMSKLDSSSFIKIFWKDVWNGYLTCDSFDAIRKCEKTKYFEKDRKNLSSSLSGSSSHFFQTHSRSNLLSFEKWKETSSIPGSWYCIDYKLPSDQQIYNHNISKERVKQLLLRYGVLFKEILITEMTHFQWARIFKTLRIMELSGEIISGQFFEEIPGLQFISPSALSILKKKLPQDSVYRINACDPASLCGISISAFKKYLPERIPSTHLYYHGPDLVMISRKNGLHLECNFPPDSTHTQRYLAKFKDLTLRSFKPIDPLRVELINGMSVFTSKYLDCLLQAGFKSDYKHLSFIA